MNITIRVLFAHLVFFLSALPQMSLGYEVIYKKNYGVQSSGCASDPVYKWTDTSNAIISNCDTSCVFDSNSVTASTLKILDTSATFSFTIASTLYSIIGVDITYVSTMPSISMTLLNGSTVTISSVSPDIATVIETSTLTCSTFLPGSTPTNLINANIISTNTNIASETGTFVIAKTDPTQILQIRSIRLWVNCAENCVTCASPTYCSVCEYGFKRHVVTIGSVTIGVCEVNKGCPSGCLQCYQDSAGMVCVKCYAGYLLSSSTNACNASIANSIYGCGSAYVDFNGDCYGYSPTGYYWDASQPVGSEWVLFVYDSAKYQCLYDEQLFVYDQQNFNVYRCGCDVSECYKCYSFGKCNACNNGWYRDGYYDYCLSCSINHCADCTVIGTGCTTCTSGYSLNVQDICLAPCDDIYCDSCVATTGPCTLCRKGYSQDGSGVCVPIVCSSAANEVLNINAGTCDCYPGFVRDVNNANLCSATATPSCGANMFLNVSANACVCKPGYAMNASNVCAVPNNSCSGVNEVWSSVQNACECVVGFVRGAVSALCDTSVSIPAAEIRQEKTANGFSIIIDCQKSLRTYAGEDIEQVVSLKMESGITAYTHSVSKIEGTSVWIVLVPQVNFRGEVAQVKFTDSVFVQENAISQSDYQIQLQDFIFVSESQKAANEAVGTVGSVASVAIISSILPIAILSNFYVIINTIDLTGFLYYLLFVDVRYPSNVLSFYDFFKNFQFPFIPNIFEYIIDADYTQEAAKPFTTNQTQLYFLSNSGQSISIVIFILTIYAVGKALSYASIPKVQNYLKRAMYETWEVSAFFDLLWTLYIYLIIGSLLQFECYDNGEGNYILNYVIHSVFAVICIVSPFGISVLLHKNKNMKSDAYFKMKFASLIGGIELFDENNNNNEQKEVPQTEENSSKVKENNDGSSNSKGSPNVSNEQQGFTAAVIKQEELNTSGGNQSLTRRQYWRVRLSKMYMGVLYIRKLLFSVIIVLLTEYTYVQLYLISILNVILVVYILYVMPLESKSENIKNAIGEMILIVIQVCVYFLVEDNKDSDEDARYMIGWIIIGLSGFIIAWHTLQLLVESIYSMCCSLKNLIFRGEKKPENLSKKVHALPQESVPLQVQDFEDGTNINNSPGGFRGEKYSSVNLTAPQQQQPATVASFSVASTSRFAESRESSNNSKEPIVMNFNSQRRKRTSILAKKQNQLSDFNKIDSMLNSPSSFSTAAGMK